MCLGKKNEAQTANVAARPKAALRVRKFRVHWFDFRSGAQCARGGNNRSGTANVAARPIGALRVRKFPLRWFDFRLGAQRDGEK